ncbi:MAG TPA: anaerobic ribonucleoside-triphosphate reductase activating protein [Bacteroidia bacterium]|nr:anaerobic ribonucleoside-triphosphate reductase activating protein [Bacteroidia bacterium]HRG52765.1 anaerobic ribonucleoside-triphosphate reductase activating protein [Bacteroidia bacterium]
MNINNASILKNMYADKPIFSITPFTLLDYPDKTACIIWFAGCNMRCVYCYNPEIVKGKGMLSVDDALNFLKSRINLIDAVVLSGGESTQYNKLSEFIRKIRELGMLVKLDTNGSNPDRIKALLADGLLDYVALDFKSMEMDYFRITGSKLFSRFVKTLTMLIDSSIAYEVRTTVHTALISNTRLSEMIDFVYAKGYRGNYYIQNFVNNTPTLGRIENAEHKISVINYPHPGLRVICRN